MNVDSALPTFVSESRELLREMEAALLACEQGNSDSEAINAIFRADKTDRGLFEVSGLPVMLALLLRVKNSIAWWRSVRGRRWGDEPYLAVSAELILGNVGKGEKL